MMPVGGDPDHTDGEGKKHHGERHDITDHLLRHVLHAGNGDVRRLRCHPRAVTSSHRRSVDLDDEDLRVVRLLVRAGMMPTLRHSETDAVAAFC